MLNTGDANGLKKSVKVSCHMSGLMVESDSREMNFPLGSMVRIINDLHVNS